jgi:L,D-peptidoglycan transpeptidase YkuD (ErfK/YbiS/YcfS/YnhG family)
MVVLLLVGVAAAFFGCSAQTADYKGIDTLSPEWVGKLDAAKDTDQLFIVAAFNQDATDAWVSLHEKQSDGKWHMVMTTPGVIGKSGIGKTKEGDCKTPQGVYHFNCAFGIADDPGCKMPYTKVDNDYYWSGDYREGHHYNELVNLKDCPDLNTENAEHIIDYIYHYQYCLNINYNRLHTPGKGSALFMHCFGPKNPFTGGCIAVPKDKMLYVMKHIQPDCLIVIDSLENLGRQRHEKG